MMADAKAVKWSAFAIIALIACAGAFLLFNAADDSDASSDGTAGDLTWTLDDSGGLIISGTGAMPDYALAHPAPWGTTATSVSLSPGITHIGNYAFYKCTSLTSITIPETVTSIGMNAFYGCTSLTSITIPDSVTTIGSGAFMGCKALGSITFGSGLASINNSAFSACTSLTSITIPDKVTSIGNSAFSGLSFTSSDGTAVEPTAANLAGAIWTRDSLSDPLVAHVWIQIHKDADISGASASILQVVIVLALVAIVLWIAADVLRKRND